MTMPSTDDTRRQLNELIALLQSFDAQIESDDLRLKVRSLIPVHERLLRLGQSLIPAYVASSARERILHYFLRYPRTVLAREEIVIVAGIDQWARRVRELRVERGWPILTGQTARIMYHEGELDLPGVDIASMRNDDYILVSEANDERTAYRWSVAKEIRSRDAGVRDRVLAYLQANVGRPVPGDELQYVAKNATEWSRRVRELRTELGWPIATRASGRPDLPIGVYLLEQNRQSPPHDRRIPDAVRRAVLLRDEYSCQKCGWTQARWHRSDPRHLELHHIVSHADRGGNTEGNLVVLCTACHDTWHASGRVGQDEFSAWLDED